MEKGSEKAGKTTARIKAIDWLRGLSVLFMIECHTLYFLHPSLEQTPDWYQLQNINGLVSVSFLFAAGFSIALVVARAAGDAKTRARRTKRSLLRILEVSLLALYINQFAHNVISHPIWLVRLDILSCIVAGLLVVWGVVTACRGRNGLALGVLSGLWVAVMGGTLWTNGYRNDDWLMIGLINNSTGAMFPLFPWVGYVMLGGVLGVLASHPTRGRKRLIVGLGVMTALMLALAMIPGDAWPWGALARRKLDTYIVSNACERLWKLGVICLILSAVERLAARVGAVAVGLRPISAVLEYFSGKSLSAYFVHLTLLYGFFGIQLTQVWHRKSNWGEYRWRLLVMYCMTAAVCYALHRARRGIEALIRDSRGGTAAVGAEPA